MVATHVERGKKIAPSSRDLFLSTSASMSI
jgi:hypothetical protein